MNKYGSYVEKNPCIDFNGKRFVFSGLPGDYPSEKDHPIVQKVIEKGGQYRAKVSNKINYFVVVPDEHYYKMNCVLKERQRGVEIKVVLFEDLKKALEG